MLRNIAALLLVLSFVPAAFAADKPEFKGQWVPIYNGKNLDGWHVIGKGTWKIQDGILIGTNPQSEKEFGHVVSNGTYKDFTARIVYKCPKGNSGFYFRIQEKGYSGVSGFQAEIDAGTDAGGLYETNGRAWVSKPDNALVKKCYDYKGWNEMIVAAHGDHLQVWLNGTKTADINDPKCAKEGKLALQVHGGWETEIQFKSIEMLKPE